MTQRDTSPNIAEIQQQISAGKFDQALSRLQASLLAQPDHPDANYMSAVCCRYTQQYAQAQTHLDAIKHSHPDKGRIYQEQAYLLRTQNKLPEAAAAFRNACQANPALAGSWRALAEIHTALGQAQEAEQAKHQIARLQSLPKALVAVTDLLAQGKLIKAEALCKQYLQKNTTSTEGMRLLADIATRLGAMEEADVLLKNAVKIAPDNQQLRIDYIQVLRKRQQYDRSAVQAKTLYEKYPTNPQAQSVYAIEKMQIGEYEAAVELFDHVLQTLPNDPITLTSKGHALKTWGQQQAAIDCYRSACAAQTDYGEAYYALSNLKTYPFSDAEIATMLTLESSGQLNSANQVHLDFALGKAFEDQQDWDRAFNYYSNGNFYKKQLSSYSAKKMTEELATQSNYFTKSVFEQRLNSGHPSPDPIFIVGLPRAGSTLLEQILSSHSMVDGTLELPNILTAAQKLRRQGQNSDQANYPELLSSLTSEALAALGKQYIDDTQIHRKGAPFFIDKMPNNFRHIGLIKLILANAKIIDARRHPTACCFSGFKQLFAEGQEFSYQLGDIAAYYNDYVQLMDHWDKVLPDAVLRVYYENVVADTESQVRRILDYCGLPFEDNCLTFYKTDRAVRTASSEQVRQPIYNSGVDQWKNFETQLQPLINKLAPSLTHYDKWRTHYR